MNAVIYARYSSDNQREESIEGQLRECMEFANSTGVTVVGNYIDRAFSAKTDNRPEFQKMIKDSYKHCFDMIIVWKLDRFARNRYDSAHYKNLLKKNGVKVVSAKESIAEGSEGILLESVLEGMAEYYSAELSEKILRGMTENALKGKMNGGQSPFGYFVDEDRKLQIDPKTAPIVQDIFTMYADGKRMQEIVDWLKAKNICTQKGKPMRVNVIQYMLSNRKYIGEYKYRNVVIPDGIPAIISQELFGRVQDRMVKNKKAPARHKAEDDYLLTTKLFCGKCGAYMVGESGRSCQKNVYRYYKCITAKRKKTCDKKPVRKEWIEQVCVEKALKVLNDDALLDVLTDRIYELQAEENPRLPYLKEQLSEVEKKIVNILSAIEQGAFSEAINERLSSLEKSKKDIETAILQEQIKRPFLTKEQIRFGIEKFKTLDIDTQDGKQRLIDGFINAVYLYDDKITIIFNYKDSTTTVSLDEYKSSDNKTKTAPKRQTSQRGVFLFRAVCSSRLSFLAQSADCFALGHRADEAYVHAHLAPKKRYQRFSLRAARPAPTKHTSTTLTCKVYGSVFCFLPPFSPVESSFLGIHLTHCDNFGIINILKQRK